MVGAQVLDLLVRLAGIEPATLGLEVRCSIQLSYRRVKRSEAAHRILPCFVPGPCVTRHVIGEETGRDIARRAALAYTR